TTSPQPAKLVDIDSLPEDVRVAWSWTHFALFLFFGFVSLLVVQGAILFALTGGRRLTQAEYEQIVMDRPFVAIGMNVLWFGAVFLFLYVTLAVLRGTPFWQTLGWRKLLSTDKAPGNPWLYFFAGGGMAIAIAIISSQLHTPDNLPIQELFKSRAGA